MQDKPNAKTEQSKTETTAAPTVVAIGEAPQFIDAEQPKDALPVGSGDFDALFTKVLFTPVSGEVYARERERRNKPSVTVGYSRKVADCMIELAGTGVYTPGTISVVQGVHEKNAHLEMSVGVWNPDTRKSSIQVQDAATKQRFQDWKDRTCARFLADCTAKGIDLNAPTTAKEQPNTVAVNLLANAPAQN